MRLWGVFFSGWNSLQPQRNAPLLQRVWILLLLLWTETHTWDLVMQNSEWGGGLGGKETENGPQRGDLLLRLRQPSGLTVGARKRYVPADYSLYTPVLATETSAENLFPWSLGRQCGHVLHCLRVAVTAGPRESRIQFATLSPVSFPSGTAQLWVQNR